MEANFFFFFESARQLLIYLYQQQKKKNSKTQYQQQQQHTDKKKLINTAENRKQLSIWECVRNNDLEKKKLLKQVEPGCVYSSKGTLLYIYIYIQGENVKLLLLRKKNDKKKKEQKGPHVTPIPKHSKIIGLGSHIFFFRSFVIVVVGN